MSVSWKLHAQQLWLRLEHRPRDHWSHFEAIHLRTCYSAFFTSISTLHVILCSFFFRCHVIFFLFLWFQVLILFIFVSFRHFQLLQLIFFHFVLFRYFIFCVFEFNFWIVINRIILCFSIFNKANGQVAPISSFESTGCIRGITNACYENGVCPLSEPRHLLDDSLLVNSEAPIATSSRCASADELSNESADGANHDAINGSSFATNGACITPISYFETDSDQIIPDDESPMHSHETVMEGCVRRKTVLKEGRKPAVASWQRYWIELFPNSLLYFAPKSFKG